jgi:hypothetical protein
MRSSVVILKRIRFESWSEEGVYRRSFELEKQLMLMVTVCMHQNAVGERDCH